MCTRSAVHHGVHISDGSLIMPDKVFREFAGWGFVRSGKFFGRGLRLLMVPRSAGLDAAGGQISAAGGVRER